MNTGSRCLRNILRRKERYSGRKNLLGRLLSSIPIASNDDGESSRVNFALNPNTCKTTTKTTSSDNLLPNCNQPLGVPLPRDEHACSVSLPTWSSVVGYEEGDSNIISALATGYPRFVYHPYVVQLMQAVLQMHGNVATEDCLILPTADAAARCQAFLQLSLENRRDVTDNAIIQASNELTTDTESNKNSRIRLVTVAGNSDSDNEAIHAVIFPAQTAAGTEAKAYWQHTGEVVSSRRAEMALVQLLNVPIQNVVTKGPNAPYVHHSSFTKFSKKSTNCTSMSNESPQNELRERIATWAQVPDKDYVFLAPSGMASIYTALRASRRYQMEEYGCALGGTSVVYGFPYLDTLKLCSRSELCPGGVEFFGRGDQRDADHLHRLLQKNLSSEVILGFNDRSSFESTIAMSRFISSASFG